MSDLIRRSTRENWPTSAWEPFPLMHDLIRWDPFAALSPTAPRLETFAFTPHFEVRETPDGYVFSADLPGVEEKDLDITFTGNRLTVSGRREGEARGGSDTCYVYERRYGAFQRSFTLPDGADLDGCEAELKNGVLFISIPKRADHRSRRISIKAIGEKVKGLLGKDKSQA